METLMEISLTSLNSISIIIIILFTSILGAYFVSNELDL